MSKFKLMLNGLLRCPVTIESLSHIVRSGDVIGKLDVHWGRNSFRENVLKSKVNTTCLSVTLVGMKQCIKCCKTAFSCTHVI